MQGDVVAHSYQNTQPIIGYTDMDTQIKSFLQDLIHYVCGNAITGIVRSLHFFQQSACFFSRSDTGAKQTLQVTKGF